MPSGREAMNKGFLAGITVSSKLCFGGGLEDVDCAMPGKAALPVDLLPDLLPDPAFSGAFLPWEAESAALASATGGLSSLTPMVAVAAKYLNGSSDSNGRGARIAAKKRIAPKLSRRRLSSTPSSSVAPWRQKRFRGPSWHAPDRTRDNSSCKASTTAVFFSTLPASKSLASMAAGDDFDRPAPRISARFLCLLYEAISASCSAKLFG
mmetsp:Transcript_13686/g.24685  ORF Transcript_13686/g.24685 Transcript_13686/m.24685 type:complete len:208 (-) Transcript_13686:283-906(-)